MNMPETALLFPGQGSQAHGMGRKLAEGYSWAMELWKKGERISGLPLRELYWDSGDEAVMGETRNLQPAITIVNLALWMHLSPRLTPACMAGHSLGEFSALCAAKVLGIDDALELVSLRGRLMSEADPENIGTMYAITRLTLDEVESICKEICDQRGKLVRVANRNTPSQYAISGHRQAIDEVVEIVKDKKGKAIPLAVSGAFHTPLMAEASAEFGKYLDKLDWKDPICPIYCNINGEPQTGGGALQTAMRKQMTSPVQWIEVIGNQWKNGVRRWVELGPKGVLTRMVRPILATVNAPEGSFTTEHIPNLEAADAFAG